ncbi:MAG: mechanosensitive ion channel family protein [Shewanella sp.]|nr:mechanosensitive ion channel family protein [Shewanella sp.]MCF1431128.1 mechanosensitive ion channel family protein [Shewanella sp.]MCF1439015.1 mechanosensitive ion channel family protein [Shewanella sp.]MCF1456676.1 mechanosensitive ion channel family protein [Shewanella sp.]
MDEKLRQDIAEWLTAIGIDAQLAEGIPTLVMIITSLLVALLAYIIVRRGVIRAINMVMKRSKATWDDSFMHFNVLEKLALLVPALVVNLLVPIALSEHPLLASLIDRLLIVAIIVLAIRALYASLDAANEIANINLVSRNMPIKSFVQLCKLFLFFVGIILCFSVMAKQSPVIFLSSLGVATGLVMLVFRDTILGFVAGIQLAANRMVSQGDWIQMDKYGANGSIEEISLTTVKVRNWDNTLTMIPAYALVQDAFKNWRGMSESGGRRITRAVNIDVATIRFLSVKDIARLEGINLLKEYLAGKKKELTEYNHSVEAGEDPVNGRYLTNIGTFRAYLKQYLLKSDKTRKDMTLLVRQLEPGPTGLPIQIYVFTNDTRWDYYEDIQADLFDHVYAILPEFGLRPFQNPSGEDMRNINSQVLRQLGASPNQSLPQ